MYRLIEWLIFHLPSSGYDEAADTNWVSWTSRCGLTLSIDYWPLDQVSISFWKWGRSWVVD